MAEDEGKGNSKGNSNAEPQGKKVAGKKLVEALAADVVELIGKLAPTVITGVEATSGVERATITLNAVFCPGGERSKSRFEVSGSAKIPAVGTSHTALFERTKEGATQLKMFEQRAEL